MQLWLDATFIPTLPLDAPSNVIVGDDGARLACHTPDDAKIMLQEIIVKYVSMFYKIKMFVSTMALFPVRQYGSAWLHKPFPSPTIEREKDIHGVLMECFWPTPLWVNLTSGGNGIRPVTYQSNLVAR